jgi:radical SAM protein with 4Fe4S-binding SPASM domain
MYIYSVVFRRVKTAPAPFALSLEPTNVCNLHCRECPTGTNSLTRTNGEMTVELYEKIISGIHKKTFYLNLYFQGEPLLNNQLPYFIQFANRYKMYTVLSTNAQLLTKAWADAIVKSGLSKIIISLDGFSQESYAKYRNGGKLELVKQGILHILQAKKDFKSKLPYVQVQVLVNKFNEHEIPQIKKWIKSLKNVCLELKSMQIYSDFNYLPENTKFNRYERKNDTWKMKKSSKSKCFRIWSQCVVTHNGDVLPCCYDKNGDFVFGNLMQNSINEVWKSEKFNDFRLKISSQKKDVSICKNCGE